VTGQSEGILMVLSVLALPAAVMFSKITYARFKRYARSPLLVGTTLCGIALAIFGGGNGWLGVCLVVPYLQVLVWAAFAWLYSLITGAELEARPFTAFIAEGKVGLAFFDSLVGVAVFAASFGLFVGFDALQDR
jgi:hypothetical protein